MEREGGGVEHLAWEGDCGRGSREKGERCIEHVAWELDSAWHYRDYITLWWYTWGTRYSFHSQEVMAIFPIM